MEFTCYVCFTKQYTDVVGDYVKCYSCQSDMKMPQSLAFICVECKNFLELDCNCSAYQCSHCFGVFALKELFYVQKFKFEVFNENYDIQYVDKWDDYIIYHDVYAKRIADSHIPLKRRKGAAAPKKNVNSYMIFCMEHRNMFKKSCPEKSFKEIGAMLGKAWREMSKEDKQEYYMKAKDYKSIKSLLE